MKKQEILQKLSDALQLEYTLDETQQLNTIEEYDSLGLLSLSSLYFENFNLEIEGQTFKNCNTVADLIELARDFIEE
ncbi:TPA: acyl carrier protein [Campylobacter coli]|nr:hypothetical protein BOP99_03035 [Campylobacter coli]HEB7537751.1 acyl carrier protein [Campylobacter coli]